MKKIRQIAFILMLALSLTTFAACGRNNKDVNDGSNNNTVTENGNRTDGNGTAGDQMENAKDNMKDAADDTKDAIGDTGDAIRDGMTGDTDTDRNALQDDGLDGDAFNNNNDSVSGDPALNGDTSANGVTENNNSGR